MAKRAEAKPRAKQTTTSKRYKSMATRQKEKASRQKIIDQLKHEVLKQRSK